MTSIPGRGESQSPVQRLSGGSSGLSEGPEGSKPGGDVVLPAARDPTDRVPTGRASGTEWSLLFLREQQEARWGFQLGPEMTSFTFLKVSSPF